MKCSYCNKPLPEEEGVSIKSNPKKKSCDLIFCSTGCFVKHFSSAAKNISSQTDRKELMAQKRAYEKARRKAVREKEYLNLSKGSFDGVYLFESLSKKTQKRLGMVMFGHIVTKHNRHVPSILQHIDNMNKDIERKEQNHD